MSVSESIQHVERAIADPPVGKPARPNARRSGFDDGLMGVALLAGPANVIMQLARPGVGYGVLESRVESGRVDLHPIKRARTTFTYLAVATAAPRRRRRLSAARSTARMPRCTRHPRARSPITPLTPSCSCGWGVPVQGRRRRAPHLCRRDGRRGGRAPLSRGDGVGHHAAGAPEMWPPDREAFDKYWRESLDKVHIDDAVRQYLYPIAAGRLPGKTLPGRCSAGRTVSHC
ncbi:hypothetical protein I552_7723 [Mycobacterium xenopi 3993]|nr:hypothetical protein I552_7723 [Mycobacterium xenopi 3993]